MNRIATRSTAICILVFAMLWMVDVHRIIFVKDRSQNAGDAAALVGARWQATSMNFIGELNLMHALASSMGDDASVDVITNTQMRVCFAGPMTGVAAAQQAAGKQDCRLRQAGKRLGRPFHHLRDGNRRGRRLYAGRACCRLR